MPADSTLAAQDERWMARALALARKGEARTHPNPMVGAVVVRRGRVVGEGFHLYQRRKHAEVLALECAGPAARGATLYVNLEPCSHMGRTGPCAAAIVAAGVGRVVAAMRDPNPGVGGKGLQSLRRAGLEVDVGALAPEARRLNEAFARWITSRRPLVIWKAALTLDGRIASPQPAERWITSRESRAEVQRLRHQADAVMTGIGTVLADDPLLTDRTGLPRRRPLLRVVLDARLRLPLQSRLARSAARDVVVFTAQSTNTPRAIALRRAGICVVRVPGRAGKLDLRAVMTHLGRGEVLSVLLEAGARLSAAALAARIVDKALLFYAPRFLGGSALPLLHDGAAGPAKQARLESLSVRRFGPDFAVEGYLRDVYRNH